MTSAMTSSPRNNVAVLANFSNGLVCLSMRMIRAKNYKTVSKFVKVMPRILWPLFFPDTVYVLWKSYTRYTKENVQKQKKNKKLSYCCDSRSYWL